MFRVVLDAIRESYVVFWFDFRVIYAGLLPKTIDYYIILANYPFYG